MGIPQPPLDLAGLMAHVARLPDSLSDAWSKALDTNDLQRGLADYEARLSTLGVALKAHYEAESATAEASGQAPVRLAGWPMTDADLVRLVTDGSSSERSANAEMLLVAEALAAATALRTPSKTVLSLPAGTEETFWESGGFAKASRTSRSMVQTRSRRPD